MALEQKRFVVAWVRPCGEPKLSQRIKVLPLIVAIETLIKSCSRIERIRGFESYAGNFGLGERNLQILDNL